jgi:hypothetical protein
MVKWCTETEMGYARLACCLLALTLTCSPTMLQAATSSTIEAPTVEAPVPTLIAAAQGEATTTELDGEEQVEVIVTRDNGDLPPDCGPRAVAAILLRFVDSWNYGDQAELAQLIAARSGIRGEGFQWYSVTEGDPRNGGRYFVTYRPEGVLEYAAERHVHGERLRIMAVDVGGGAISASASPDRRTTRSLGLKPLHRARASSTATQAASGSGAWASTQTAACQLYPSGRAQNPPRGRTPTRSWPVRARKTSPSHWARRVAPLSQ